MDTSKGPFHNLQNAPKCLPMSNLQISNAKTAGIRCLGGKHVPRNFRIHADATFESMQPVNSSATCCSKVCFCQHHKLRLPPRQSVVFEAADTDRQRDHGERLARVEVIHDVLMCRHALRRK
jgi:hypothetical protein